MVFSQPILSNPFVLNRVGTETVDPPLWTGGICPPGDQCRASDSAFIKRDAGVSSKIGFLARTNNKTPPPTPIPDPNPPPPDLTAVGNWRIVYKSGAIVVNLLLNKVGRTTGWTQGGVTKACETYVLRDAFKAYTLVCQHRADIYGQTGDSGAPVFMIWNKPKQYDVWLVGLYFGVGWFSDIGRIQFDLGTLYVLSVR